MEWTNVVRKLSDLQPWERNPRQINEKQAERLKESFEDFGQVETIAIGPESEVYNGHQRLNVLMAQHGGDYEIECRQSDRALSEKEREKLTVFLHKGAAGEWDWDILANEFEMDDLLDWGFDEDELGIFDLIDDKYTKNINAPIYEPSDWKPGIEELYNRVRSQELIEKIERSEIEEDIKKFLVAAALRHTVFNYKLIADYYSHASREVQELMEDSGLVIIDFHKAIELGYVRLSKKVAEEYNQEYDE